MAHATTAVHPAFSRSVRRRADTFARWLARARSGDERGIHQARVATRRLREAMPLLVAAGACEAPHVLRDLRRLTRALGPVRELDVARGILQDLAQRHGWVGSLTLRVDRHCARLRAQRMETLLDTIDRIDAPGVPARVDAMLTSLDAAPPRAAAALFVAPRLRRRARALARAIDRAGTLYAPTPLHDTRLSTKKLRYLLELGASISGTPIARLLRPLKTLQALLGDIHDLQIVQQSLQEAAAAGRTDRLAERRLTQMDQDVERTCRELHARYLRLAPGVRELAAGIARDAGTRVVGGRERMLKMPLAPPRRRARIR